MTQAPMVAQTHLPILQAEDIKTRWLLGGSAKAVFSGISGLEDQSDLSMIAVLGQADRLNHPVIPTDFAEPLAPAPIVEGQNLPLTLLRNLQPKDTAIGLALRYGFVLQLQDIDSIKLPEHQAYQPLINWVKTQDGTDYSTQKIELTDETWDSFDTASRRRALEQLLIVEPTRVWEMILKKFDASTTPQKQSLLNVIGKSHPDKDPVVTSGWLGHPFLVKVSREEKGRTAEIAQNLISKTNSEIELKQLKEQFFELFKVSGGILRRTKVELQLPKKASHKQKQIFLQGLSWVSPEQLCQHLKLDLLKLISCLSISITDILELRLAHWLWDDHTSEKLLALLAVGLGKPLAGYANLCLPSGSSERLDAIELILADGKEATLHDLFDLHDLDDPLLDWDQISHSALLKSYLADLKESISTSTNKSNHTRKVWTNSLNHLALYITPDACEKLQAKLTNLGVEPHELDCFQFHSEIAKLANNPATKKSAL